MTSLKWWRQTTILLAHFDIKRIPWNSKTYHTIRSLKYRWTNNRSNRFDVEYEVMTDEWWVMVLVLVFIVHHTPHLFSNSNFTLLASDRLIVKPLSPRPFTWPPSDCLLVFLWLSVHLFPSVRPSIFPSIFLVLSFVSVCVYQCITHSPSYRPSCLFTVLSVTVSLFFTVLYCFSFPSIHARSRWHASDRN